MKKDSKRLDDLERLLVSAYREGGAVTPGRAWKDAVMAEIRRLGPFGNEGNGQALVERFAWRFAAAACFVALVLLAYVFSSGLIDYQDLAMRFIDDPIDFLI